MGPRLLGNGGRRPTGAIVLGLTTMGTIGAILYSHYSQLAERKLMKAGVERDKERLRQKRRWKMEQQQQHQKQQQQQSDNHHSKE